MRFDIHVFHHIAEDGATERKLDRVLAGVSLLQKEVAKMSPEVEKIVGEVAETRTAVSSILALVAGMATQIRDNVDDRAALLSLADDLDAEQARIAEAVTANTPDGGQQTDGGTDTNTDPADPDPVEGEPAGDELDD